MGIFHIYDAVTDIICCLGEEYKWMAGIHFFKSVQFGQGQLCGNGLPGIALTVEVARFFGTDQSGLFIKAFETGSRVLYNGSKGSLGYVVGR
ncbi:hypothetical protein D3C80_1833590 [compost metagenome]